MKSAFELAMERMGGPLKEYSPEQKEQLAQIDRIADSKLAQAKFDLQARLAQAGGDAERLAQVQRDMEVELASIESKRDRDKDALRKQFDSE